MTEAHLIDAFWCKLPELLETCRTSRENWLTIGEVQVKQLTSSKKSPITLMWSAGCSYHTDDPNNRYSNILVLNNPGYEVKIKTDSGTVVSTESYLELNTTHLHKLRWSKGYYVRRRDRENWVAVVIDSEKKFLTYKQFSQRLIKFLEG